MSETQTMTLDWADSLLRLLEEQEALVNELACLADRQAELIRRAQTDALLSLLTRRQQIIERFAGTQDDLSRLTGDLEARLETVSPAQRQRIQSLIGEIGDRLAQVMQCDEKDQRVLEAARNRTKDELATVDNARQARRAYRSGGAVDNRFADQRG